jgi:hypothetical protein
MRKIIILKSLMKLVVILGVVLTVQGLIIYSKIPSKLEYLSISEFGLDGGASMRRQVEKRNQERKEITSEMLRYVLTGLTCVVGGIVYVYLNRYKKIKDGDNIA